MYQVESLHKEFDLLQQEFGEKGLCSIYGAGQIHSPKYFFMFMNPTKRNVSASYHWKGIRAPWLGTKLVWKLFNTMSLLSEKSFSLTQSLHPSEWNEEFAGELYSALANNSVYITNFAKCTQNDARALPNSVFKKYLELAKQEIQLINPQKIITFGNQVSSILLDKPVSVSNYSDNLFEELIIGSNSFAVYPTYYPVGQGQRNMPLTIRRLKTIIK